MTLFQKTWDLFNWHVILWYGRTLYKGSFATVFFVVGDFGIVPFVLTPFQKVPLQNLLFFDLNLCSSDSVNKNLNIVDCLFKQNCIFKIS